MLVKSEYQTLKSNFTVMIVSVFVFSAGKVKAEGDSEAVSDTNSYGGGIRSTNAPSLGASIKGSMFDVANLDTTHSPIPEEDMSQGEENQCKKNF